MEEASDTMDETSDTNVELKTEIQNELLAITTAVAKIKQELHEINNIIQTDGSLDTALENGIESLVLIAQETGVAVGEPTGGTEEDNPMSNALSKITSEYITEKLEALSHM